MLDVHEVALFLWFDYGWFTMVLGMVLHFTIAIGAASVYYLFTLKFPTLLLKPPSVRPGLRAGMFLFMQHVVVPLSAAYPKTGWRDASARARGSVGLALVLRRVVDRAAGATGGRGR